MEKEVVAVYADNSNDDSYPQVKNKKIRFYFFGGIYRDVWLISHKNFISHPLIANKVAGGGVFVHFENLSEKSVEIIVKADVVNESKSNLSPLMSLIDKHLMKG